MLGDTVTATLEPEGLSGGVSKGYMTDRKTDTRARRCLVVDDEADIRKTLALALEADGWEVECCDSLAAARHSIEESQYDLALVDLRLGAQSGLDLLPLLNEAQPGIPIIMITAYATISTAVEAMRRGAVDYLPKPFTPVDVRRASNQALALRAVQRREADLESQMLLVSTSTAVRELMAHARKAAASNSALLLRGETGTGKGVLARAIHYWSLRGSKPFVVVACPALPADLLESELFGHAQGAFIGAYRDHKGRVAQAEGGTLFLDEIGDLPMPLQAKLLRLLQEKKYERLGENQTHRADVRIVAATQIDLRKAIAEGSFREDLYHRLNVIELVLPPLRERLEDLEGLSAIMLADLKRETGGRATRLSGEVSALFRTHHWPGNMRELRNILERACVLGDGDEVTLKHLSSAFGSKPEDALTASEKLVSLDELERNQIRKVLGSSRTLVQAAKILGVDIGTLWRKRKKYKL
jgi:NtrC-family two-component system response regulator AlgB